MRDSSPSKMLLTGEGQPCAAGEAATGFGCPIVHGAGTRPLRRGFTIIETVIVAGLEFTVFAVVVGLFLLVAETRAKWQQREPARLAAQRLATQFRNDIHDAAEITVENEKLTLSLASGVKVTYTVETGEFPEQKHLHRVEQKDDSFVRQEDYAVPDYSTVWFTQGKDGFAGLTALNIWTQPVTSHRAEQSALPKPESLNPFTRESTETPLDTHAAAYWRTVIAKNGRKTENAAD